jgi:hypothetical protein
MQALSSPRAQTELAARDLLLGCIVQGHPRFLSQALRLVQSIHWFGGELARAQVRICVVGGLDRSFRRSFERYGVEVRIVSPFAPSHRAARWRSYPEVWETDREMLLLLDCDTVVVKDPIPWMRRGALQATIAPLPTVAPKVLEQVFDHYGLPLPASEHVNRFAKTATIPYCDRGVILLPSHLARQILSVWHDYDARLAEEPEILRPYEQQRGPTSLSLALAACQVPFTEAPIELNFPLNLTHLPPPEGFFALDPAILHYYDRVVPEGYLFHTPYPLVQVRIDALNRRLREEKTEESERAGFFPKKAVPEKRAQNRPVPSAAPAAQVVVLGMHRSGTSALTSLLRLLGLWAGEEDDFPPEDDHNPTGYWEHQGVWSVDEAILRTLGASWSEIADLDLSRLGEDVRDRFRERAREIVQDLDRHGSWVIKDPRLCLLFPFWREILEHPFCVLIYREPLPVARSLAARNGIPIPYSIALWERYTREMLASTRGLPRFLVSHRELIADPEGTLRRLHRQMARHRPELARLAIPGAEEIRAVVDPGLVRHPHEPEIERSYLTAPQAELLAALADGTALDLDPVPPLSAGARDLLASYQSLQATARELRERLAAAQATREANLDGTLPRLGAAPDAEDLQRALSWLDELDAILSATLESRSWKIGRTFTTAMGKLLGWAQISAPERRDRLMAEVRRWRQDGEEK